MPKHAFAALALALAASLISVSSAPFCKASLDVQRAIGIPVPLFTAIFALARTVGWIAQLNEMIGDPEYKIGRPRQLFEGSPKRDVKPISAR